MKRMNGIVCFCLLLSLVLTGCGDGSGPVPSGPQSDVAENNPNYLEKEQENTESGWISLPVESDRQVEINKMFETIDHQKAYRELIKSSIDWNESKFQEYFYRRFHPLRSYIPMLDMIDKDYPIECLRDMGNGRKYAVYSSEDGGLFYLFFREEIDLSHSAYVSKPKGKKDFNSIQVGDTFDQVAVIDPDVKKWSESYSMGTSDPDATYSVHLLKDGFLQYTYKDGKVTDIYYSPDFVYKQTFGTSEGEMVIEYDYSILSQDYPS